jgi:thioredoxin 1
MKQKTKSIMAIVFVLLFVLSVAVVKETKTKNAEPELNNGKNQEQTTTNPKMIEIGSDTCVPCIMMDEVLEELREEYSNVLDVEFIHAKNEDMVKKYGINAIPTQIFFDKAGKEIFRHSGYFSTQEIINTFYEMGIELDKNK